MLVLSRTLNHRLVNHPDAGTDVLFLRQYLEVGEMNTRMLKKHLNYRIPKVTLALLREPSRKELPAIVSPLDLTEYVDPLRHYADYVTRLDMCRSLRSA